MLFTACILFDGDPGRRAFAEKHTKGLNCGSSPASDPLSTLWLPSLHPSQAQARAQTQAEVRETSPDAAAATVVDNSVTATQEPVRDTATQRFAELECELATAMAALEDCQAQLNMHAEALAAATLAVEVAEDAAAQAAKAAATADADAQAMVAAAAADSALSYDRDANANAVADAVVQRRLQLRTALLQWALAAAHSRHGKRAMFHVHTAAKQQAQRHAINTLASQCHLSLRQKWTAAVGAAQAAQAAAAAAQEQLASVQQAAAAASMQASRVSKARVRHSDMTHVDDRRLYSNECPDNMISTSSEPHGNCGQSYVVVSEVV